MISGDRSSPEPIIRLTNVSRRYRSGRATIHAVRGVSLSLAPGTTTALVGPSGSGKTTLVNLVVGAEPPDDGSVDRRHDLGDSWHHIAFVPQGLGLMGELTIAENIELPGRLGGPTPRRSGELIDSLELRALGPRFPADVSLGEQQRAAVARAAIVEPSLLVADEPTAHQDEGRARAVMDELCGLATRGSAVLIATHERRILDRVDSIITMRDGEIVESATSDRPPASI